jgi:polar amino acid transport system substrate-binding protein
MRGCAMRIAGLCLLAIMPLTVLAEPDATVYINSTAPFAYVENGVMKGVIFDLIREMQTRMGHKQEVSSVPFKRLTAKLSENASAFAVLPRDSEIEANYTWVVKLLDEKIMLVTRRDAPFDISSPHTARKLKAGVVLGSPADRAARRYGFESVEATGTAESNARKLAVGRIDIWIGASGVVTMGQRLIGKNVEDLRFGAMLEPLNIYLVCPLSCPKPTADRWRAVFSAMVRDGTYARILSRYHYPDPAVAK